jgi:hypothetical protein
VGNCGKGMGVGALSAPLRRRHKGGAPKCRRCKQGAIGLPRAAGAGGSPAKLHSATSVRAAARAAAGAAPARAAQGAGPGRDIRRLHGRGRAERVSDVPPGVPWISAQTPHKAGISSERKGAKGR